MNTRRLFLILTMCLGLVAVACDPQPGGGGPPSTPPIAVIAPSTTSGGAPLSVNFDGSDSVDPDGAIVRYDWDFGDGTTGSGAVVDHTFGTGTWRTQLLVTDNSGKIGTAFVDITVTNTPPVASFTASPTSGAAPLDVVLDASESSDPDGPIASYDWTFTDLASRSGQVINQTFAPGTYTVTLTVTDLAGATESTTRTVTASGAPGVPTDLAKTGSGCCNTYGDFAWTTVPGADGYQIEMDGFFGGGCVTDHGAVLEGQRSTGRVQAVGLCLGSKYDVRIRARSNGTWGPWSPDVRITL